LDVETVRAATEGPLDIDPNLKTIESPALG